MRYVCSTQLNVKHFWNDDNISNINECVYTCQKCAVISLLVCVAFSLELFTHNPNFNNISNFFYDFHLLYEWILLCFFLLSNHKPHSKLHPSFMLFISNFHSISWIYYNLFTTILWQYTEEEKKWWKTGREDGENETQIYIIRLYSRSPYTHIFHAILLLHHNSYTMREEYTVCVCVFHYFCSLSHHFLFLPLGKCFSMHAFWRFSPSHSPVCRLLCSFLPPLFVRSRKIMHK